MFANFLYTGTSGTRFVLHLEGIRKFSLLCVAILCSLAFVPAQVDATHKKSDITPFVGNGAKPNQPETKKTHNSGPCCAQLMMAFEKTKW